jgi:ABC-type transport system involved in multi-copper enzyme maturation permease subunit
MGNKTFLYIGGGFLGLIGLCLFGYGFILILGSTSGSGSASWLGYGIGFSAGSLALIGAAVWLIVTAVKAKQPEVAQNITYKVDLPAQTKIEEMKCRSCGGSLKADNIKMLAGAPTVECPFCGTTYQLTEEPKW